MKTIRFSGLPTVSGSSARERRQSLLDSSDNDLAELLLHHARELRGTSQTMSEPIRAAVQVPAGEVLASPFAFRICAMAAEQGATTVHVETRDVLNWPKTLRGEHGTRDPSHGVWDRGRLQLGKYQQFLQDEPLAVYQPQHVSKWAPHELLHRVCGFFYRPGCSRWELYLGARLNELLPVVTWYGAEQTMRLDELEFDRALAAGKPGASLEEAHWLNDKPEALRRRALNTVSVFRAGLQHFERELNAIDEELRTGRIVRAPHPVLDSSSDALAYVAGHFPRLRTMGEPLCQLVPTSMGRYESVYEYREFIETVFDALLFRSFEPDLERGDRLREARRLWDIVHRGLQVSHRAVARLVNDAGRDIRRALDGDRIDVTVWRNRVMAAAGKSGAAVVATGDVSGHALGLEQLALGLQSCVPRALESVGDRCVAMLSVSDVMWTRAPLSERFARWLEGESVKRSVKELAWLENAIAGAETGDDRIERLCESEPLPEVLDEVVLVINRAFSRHAFENDVLSLHAGEDMQADSTLYVGVFGDEIAVVPVPPVIESVLTGMETPQPAVKVLAALESTGDPRGWLSGLLAGGLIGWTYRPYESNPEVARAPAPAKPRRAKKAK